MLTESRNAALHCQAEASGEPPPTPRTLETALGRGGESKAMEKKEFIPQIRVISVDHDRTSIAERRLRKSMDANGLQNYPVRSVYCHLESGRCGVPSGQVAIEVEGRVIWLGPELTEELAEQFSRGLPAFAAKIKRDLGLE